MEIVGKCASVHRQLFDLDSTWQEGKQANPCGDGQVLLVNISSIKPDQFHDPACEIAGGAHPSIPNDSFVSYKHALAMPVSKIQKFVDSWYYHPKEPVSDDSLFERICAGIEKSEFTPFRIMKYYAANRDR
ncbi:hypothetical protein [Mesorhizobium sp.]|uniref:hypothetical protein n=1 Tax=Mesorhizobium sp. TaxID=1871066 RepID=UPI000FE675B6|nr:hypothetical protein [Mesorhizobium sp.]RWI20333.1 MAG: hypothetical protein EOQ92_20630 [Mesorhizobium sp.]RWK44809.1 MAG: hypothetical protein EOR47_33955 [Mesorhizobium sp.]RWK95532.1 MAG: hypothetical protein EOR53_12770 [Mesorhizobium sp.]TIP56037.1 MAG: hypothetical protein E5X56_26265 [Mesorhizobium sp.]TIP93833.1 MAG: hypothetical protein E5X60_24175 [Mesorhizobium sp.]